MRGRRDVFVSEDSAEKPTWLANEADGTPILLFGLSHVPLSTASSQLAGHNSQRDDAKWLNKIFHAITTLYSLFLVKYPTYIRANL
jgi:hypothetical protein